MRTREKKTNTLDLLIDVKHDIILRKISHALLLSVRSTNATTKLSRSRITIRHYSIALGMIILECVPFLPLYWALTKPLAFSITEMASRRPKRFPRWGPENSVGAARRLSGYGWPTSTIQNTGRQGKCAELPWLFWPRLRLRHTHLLSNHVALYKMPKSWEDNLSVLKLLPV